MLPNAFPGNYTYLKQRLPSSSVLHKLFGDCSLELVIPLM